MSAHGLRASFSPDSIRRPGSSSLCDPLPGTTAAVDPFAPAPALPKRSTMRRRGRARGSAPREVVKTALTVQVRDGHLHVFMPPLVRVEDYAALLAAIEDVAGAMGVHIAIEGYAPP